ncbi:MAG TPA: flagellar biosynthetic protein FliR [Kofleriaceae bacterium]|nr:flagellar biosynthetic protein FliR [Kofleriaceae bacterium]
MTVALWAWLLVIARVAPIAWWAPPGDDAPAIVRVALGIGLSALVASALPPASVVSIAVMSDPARLALVVREAAIGAVIAVVATVPVVMAEAAGRLADLARGAADGDDALARFTRITALVVFFGIGGPLAVARALADSYAALPIGGGAPAGAGAVIEHVAIAAAQLVAASMWIAVPWILTGAIVELGAAAARRASGLVGGMAPIDGARAIAVVGAVGLGAIGAAAVMATQIRDAMAMLSRLWA